MPLFEPGTWPSDLNRPVTEGKMKASSHWIPNEARSSCSACGKKFTALRRKHHCRACGEVVCNECSPNRLLVQGLHVRVCCACFNGSPPKPSVSDSKARLKPKRKKRVSGKIRRVSNVRPWVKEKTMHVSILSLLFGLSGSITGLVSRGGYGDSMVASTLLIISISLCVSLSLYLIVLTRDLMQILINNEKVLIPVLERKSEQESPIVETKEIVEACSQMAEGSAVEIATAFDIAMEAFQYAKGQDGWELHSTQEGVEILIKTEKDLTYVRGEIIVDVPMDKLIRAMQEHPLEIDLDVKLAREQEVFATSVLLEQLKPKGVTQVSKFSCRHIKYHPLFPIAARDTCVAESIVALKPKDSLSSMMIISRSVEREDVPHEKDYFRLKVISDAIIFEQVSKDCPNQTRIKSVTTADPMGYIPSFVVSIVAPDQALLLHRLSECAKRHYMKG